MFQDEFDRLAAALGLSDGELLKLARHITESDTLRPIDKLTMGERELLLQELRSLLELERVPV